MRFNVEEYDPREDSQGTEKEGLLVIEVGQTIPDEEGKDEARETCLCGCGEVPTGKKARFVMGHDARLKGMLTRAHIAGTKVELTRNGKAAKEITARAFAKEQGDEWVARLEKSEADYAEKAKKRAEREAAAAKAREEAQAAKDAETQEALEEAEAEAAAAE